MSNLVELFRRSRRDAETAVLEGFHAIKHAVRFGAEIRIIVAAPSHQALILGRDLAPDVVPFLEKRMEVVDEDLFDRLSPTPPKTRVIALASRRTPDPRTLLLDPRPGDVVLLENPRNLGNLGAAVRVAAAVGAAGVLTTGTSDPWGPAALRGSAGLHYAVPVARLDCLDELSHGARPLIAFHPGGNRFDPLLFPGRSVVAFGSERHGLTPLLQDRVEGCFALQMREGVSSLNLASTVAVALYSVMLSR